MNEYINRFRGRNHLSIREFNDVISNEPECSSLSINRLTF